MFLSDPTDRTVTFGTPGGNDPFSMTLRDALKVEGPALDALQTGASPSEDEIRKSADAMSRGFWAAERQTRLVDTINARQNALIEAAENRIAIVQKQTGVQLENPFTGGYQKEARDRLGAQLDAAGGLDETGLPAAQRDIFNEKLDEVAQNFPDKAASLQFFQSLDDQARAIGASAAQGNAGSPGGIIPEIAGGLWGSRRDPLFVGSLLVGPGSSQAATALGRVAYGALKQGLFNAGLSLAAQPAVQAWRAEIGEKTGVYPALENVGMAFVFGAIPGAAIEGVKELARPTRSALERLATGTPRPGDVEAVTKHFGVTLDDDTARAIKTAEADMTHDAVAAADRPEGLPAPVAADIERQALRHAEDPVNNPPPPLASPAAAAPDVPAAERVMGEFEARPFDGVEALRGNPALIEGALHSEAGGVAPAGRLALLSDEAWGLVRDGRAAPEHGVIVGELSPDPIYDGPVLARVTEARPDTPAEARQIAAEAIESESRRMQAAINERVIVGPTSFKTTPIPGKSLFHETSPENAAQLLMDDMTNSADRVRTANLFVADNRDIAIGHGGQGVQIEFSGDLVSGTEHFKPGTGDLAGREYRVNALGNGAIKSISVMPGATLRLKPSWQARLSSDFDRAVLPDGTVQYTRKAARAEARPAEALSPETANTTPAPSLSHGEASQAAVAMPDGSRADVMDLVPMLRDDGTVVLATRDAALAMADNEAGVANLVRACNL